MAGKRAAAETSLEARKRARLAFEFDDVASSDVVVRLIGESSEGAESSEADLHLHKSILVEHSTFFSAQLSDRWADGCARDEQGLPILEVKDCSNVLDFSTAMKKLYQKVPGEVDYKLSHSFSGVEDALCCLVPADRLGLQSVFASAVAYLESVPWTLEQESKLRRCLHESNMAAKGLLDRLDPHTEKWEAEILDALFAGATAQKLERVLQEPRRFIAEVLKPGAVQRKAALEALRRCLRSLKEGLSHLEHYSTPWFLYSAQLIRSLAWIMRMLQEPTDHDLRREVASLLPLLHTPDKKIKYREVVFPQLVSSTVYPALLKEVQEGALILDLELRQKFLQMYVPMWAPKYDSPENSQLKEMKAAFGAVLSSVPRKVQEEILHEWIPDLIASTPWDPWFREWMDKAFTVQNEHTGSQKQEVRFDSS
jgi:hypothetical protein